MSKKVDLTKYSNSIKVNLKAPLIDWHAVKAELLSKSYVKDIITKYKKGKIKKK